MQPSAPWSVVVTTRKIYIKWLALNLDNMDIYWILMSILISTCMLYLMEFVLDKDKKS